MTRLSLVFAGTLLFTGCDSLPYRINHRHDDGNQKAAEEALKQFDAFTGDAAGLRTTLLKNLDAQETLSRTVAETDALVGDVDRVNIVAVNSWNGVREHLFNDLGLEEEPTKATATRTPREIKKSGGPIQQHVSDSPVLDKRHDLLDERVLARLEKVGIVIDVLSILIEQRQEVVKEASKAVKSATNYLSNVETTNTPPLASTNQIVDLLSLVKSFERAIVESARQALTNAQEAGLVGDQVQFLLKAAESSRDPASVYALVPLVGSGLDHRSLAMLDLYTEALRTNKHFMHISQPARQGESRLNSLKQSLEPFTQPQTLKGNGDAQEAIKSKGGELEEKGKRLLKQLDAGSKLNKSLNLNLEGLEKALDQFKTSATSTNMTPTRASDILASLAAQNPRLRSVLTDTNLIKEADLKQLRVVLSDINSEKQAARKRLLEFFAEVSRVQLDLAEENLRHDQAVVAVARSELERWRLIRESATRFRVNYLTRDLNSEALCSLFNERVETAWSGHYKTNAPNFAFKAVDAPLRPPQVRLEDTVIASVRRLAENARAWQRASPSSADPLGLATRHSNMRLNQAIQIVQGYLLMTSLNQRYAVENAITLKTEVLEHDIHIDSVVYRAREASIRYDLKDLLAFHSSGYTAEDVQAVIGIAQSALLAWIGYQQ